MSHLRNLMGRRLSAILFVFTYFAYSFVGAQAQTSTASTTINVTSQVQHASVARLGINMEDQDYWDSAQILKNLVFINPGFEAESYRTILDCVSVSSNTCTDVNAWSPMTANQWKGATFQVISGNAAGVTGTVSANTAAVQGSKGMVFTFGSSPGIAAGDYVMVSENIPGNGQNGWWTYTNGGATITSETTDLSSETPGKQALAVNASSSGMSATVNSGWDTWGGKSFVQMNGDFALTFRAKGTGGSNQVNITLYRMMTGEAQFINKTITLTSSWQDYTIPFTASETGSSVGNMQLNFNVAGASMELDDVSVAQTNGDSTNTSAFRDAVVDTLKTLHPGTLRMYGGASVGTNIYDDISPAFARYPEGITTTEAVQSQTSYGITEFLQLCQLVGADPWITIPPTTTPQEMTDFMDYLQGDGSTTYSAVRVAAGQAEPWTSVFNKIHIEFGNETWNSSFMGAIMGYPAYPKRANQIFGAARASAGFVASKYDLILDGFASVPGYTLAQLQYSTQHDSTDIAPYLLGTANNDTVPNLFNSLFAEPEMYDAPGGEVYGNLQSAQAVNVSGSGTSKPTGLNVYEVNMSTFNGSITQAEMTAVESSLGAGLALADHMLQMMRIGVNYQNVFGLTGYHSGTSNGETADLWGTVVDMGVTNLKRPTFLSEQLANTAIMGDMLQTQQTGNNPTYNEPLSSDNVQYNGVHYIQSFAFVSGTSHSLVLFNLSQTTPLPVTFTGANAPIGSVAVNTLNSANITDNNETSDVVQIASSSLSGVGSSTSYTLPAHSMTVMTWTGAEVETGASQAATPTFSVASGTYPSAQTVSITEASPGTSVYYTTDGSTPTTSSSVYSSPLTVSSTETLNAIAIGEGYTNSATATAKYAIATTLPAPTVTPVGSTYSSAQTVTMSASAGATIYYTTNGTTPTTSSTKYTAPFTLSASTTINAIAAYSGYSNSAVTSEVYTFVSGTTQINYANGFPATSGLTFNGGSGLTGTSLQLTDGGASEARTVWYNTKVPVSSFITDFTFQQTNATANGFTFTVQNAGLGAVEGNGGSMAYQGMPTSVALKFDLYNSGGEGTDSTGVYTNGASPTTPSTDLTSTGVNLHSGDIMQAHVVYDGTYLTLTLTDTVTKAVAVEKYTVNIPSIVGGTTAYVGFTASTGGLTATQIVPTWTYVSTTAGSAATVPVAATPTFSVAAGSYTVAQSVTISDTTSGATIYYTTDGTTPTTSSNKYTGAVALTSSTKLQAIAVASGYTNSNVASAAYTITISTSTGTGSSTGSTTSTGSTSTSSSLLINASSGFTATTTNLVGGATLSGSTLLMTNGALNTVSAAWYPTAVAVNAFSTDFDIMQSGTADGLTFTIQGVDPKVIGAVGSGLGSQGLAKSVSVKFDIHDNAGEGNDSTGVYLDGAAPTVPATDLSSTNINLSSNDKIHAHLTYDGQNLVLKLTDVATGGTATETYPVNIVDTVGSSTAYVGFTGATGTSTSTQKIIDWSYSAGVNYVATPVFNLVSGTYTSAQQVTIGDATPGVNIYYTTNGTTPTTASTLYTGPITVNSSMTLEAIAVLPATTVKAAALVRTLAATAATTSSAASEESAATSASYQILVSNMPVDFLTGMSSSGLKLNGGAALSGSYLMLTDGGSNEARSAWYTTPVSVTNFTTWFTFLQTNADADGFTFTIQNTGTSALGTNGGSLGYAGIGKSVAIKFDLYNSAGEGSDSTGLYTDGAQPKMPSTDLTSTGINLHSGHKMKAGITYNGTTLILTLMDTVTGKTATESYTVNIPSIVGGNTAYVGFTGADGGATSTQEVLTWTYATN